MELKTIRLSKSIYNTFEDVNLEMLPEEIRSHELFHWINQFSSPFSETDVGEYDLNYRTTREDIILLNHISRMIRNSSTVCIQYYYASLFLIGRQMKVSRQQIKYIEKSLSQSNLERTFLENEMVSIQLYLDNSHVDTKREFISNLKRVLEDARDLHSANYEIAQELWKYWIYEIDVFRHLVENVSLRISDINFRNLKFWEKETILLSVIDITTYNFVKSSLHKHLYKNGYRSQVSYDDIFAENLYLFTNVLNYFFSPFESYENRQIHKDFYKRYYSRSLQVIKKLKNSRNKR